MQDLYIFLTTIVILFILWLSLGDHNQNNDPEGKFIRRPGTIEQLEVYDEPLIDNERLQNRIENF